MCIGMGQGVATILESDWTNIHPPDYNPQTMSQNDRSLRIRTHNFVSSAIRNIR